MPLCLLLFSEVPSNSPLPILQYIRTIPVDERTHTYRLFWKKGFLKVNFKEYQEMKKSDSYRPILEILGDMEKGCDFPIIKETSQMEFHR